MRHAHLALALCLSLSACDRAGPAPTAEPEPRVIAVDWQGRGTLYAATVVGERAGLTGVRYADGDREWVEPRRLQPWPPLPGRDVTVWTRGAAQPARVTAEREGLFQVRFADGAETWIAPDMLYALEAPSAGVTPTDTPPSFPARAPADFSGLRPGAHVLAYWISGGEVSRGRPYVCEVLSVASDGIGLRYLEDGSEATVSSAEILRVFAPGTPTTGQRHWLVDAAPVGTVLEQRAGLTKLRVGEAERWVEGLGVLEPAPPLDRSRLTPGALVTALWNGSSLYHATVESVSGGQVTLRWHDGSEPSAVPVEDILERWDQ